MDGRAQRGQRGERAAAAYLTRRGWRIVARRWRGAGGEIDLVALRAGTLAVCEVKTRGDGDALAEPVTAAQRRRIAQAARALLAARPELGAGSVRLDLITVHPGRLRARVRHLPGGLGDAS